MNTNVSIKSITLKGLILFITFSFVFGCAHNNKAIDDDVSNSGMLLNDDLIAYRSDNGITIKNTVTGITTIRDVKLDWTQVSRNDSMAVFCSENRRGYYNMYTGEIAVPAQYRRAWIFSEGLAGVQKNANIGFIDRKGQVVIDFKYPYHGNPLSSFIFENGHCVVADTAGSGHVGVIDNKGKWLIEPVYDYISAFKEYAIATKAGINLQINYDGTIINSFVLDDIDELSYTKEECYYNADGDLRFTTHNVKTGFFRYTIGGRCGLMDSNCVRLTEPLYRSIKSIKPNMFIATLLDYDSEVIINELGEVIK